MQVSAQVTFHNMDRSEYVEARVNEHLAKLEQLSDRITRCRVVIEASHRRHRQGNLFTARLNIALPGGEIVVNRDAAGDHAHEDVYVAVRDSFFEAERQLKEYVDRKRGEIKFHQAPLHGTITQVFPDKGYGFIETQDVGEIYFHRNSVVESSFEALIPGSEVRFVLSQGEKGLQASTVKPVGKHRIVAR
ncbi:MAG: HPF/RaiA family ribosome-associated protein [Rhodospirillales bacterium]|nr:HPF/RaiA family ribosome-associated protein [Rhodospirillales bacterium]